MKKTIFVAALSLVLTANVAVAQTPRENHGLNPQQWAKSLHRAPERARLTADYYRALMKPYTTDYEALEAFNIFVNRNIYTESDGVLYNDEDHWATPTEILRSGYGDCEDFALMKYAGLLAAGVSPNKLAIGIGTVYHGDARDGLGGKPHAALLYSEDGTFANPLVLDNYVASIRPYRASESEKKYRHDLVLKMRVNASGAFMMGSGRAAPVPLMNKFTDFTARAKREGFYWQ